MVNLAVINIKDITQFLIKFFIVVVILYIINKMLFSVNTRENQIIKKVDSTRLFSLLDNTIPGMKQLKDTDDYSHLNLSISNLKPTELILESQLRHAV